MLKAVLFDLDNTLVDRDRAFRECVHAHFANAAVRDELLALDRSGRGDRETLCSCWTRYSGFSISPVTLGLITADRIQPDPALLSALRTLAGSVKLGVITNGGGEVQRRKFFSAGLADVISPDNLWISGEVGYAKPQPEIFLMALAALGEAPGHCLFVGDHEQDDIAGAVNVGMRARLVERALDAAHLESLLSQELAR